MLHPQHFPEPSRAGLGTALRAGVLGATDGLVSNLSLVMGMAGSGVSHEIIVIAGLAGLVAGALSMGLGEYLSVQSTRELFANELAIEARHLRDDPAAEVDELCAIYERKGIPMAQAHELAEPIVHGDPDFALDTMAREELGFDPNQLGGSAWVAAGTSLALFAAGGAGAGAADPRERGKAWPLLWQQRSVASSCSPWAVASLA